MFVLALKSAEFDEDDKPFCLKFFANGVHPSGCPGIYVTVFKKNDGNYRCSGVSEIVKRLEPDLKDCAIKKASALFKESREEIEREIKQDEGLDTMSLAI